MKPAAILLLASFAFPMLLSAEDFKPTLPLLELQLKDGRVEVTSNNHDEPLDDEAVKEEIEQLAKYQQESSGWTGLSPDGTSENPLVLHVDPMVDQAAVNKIVETALDALVYRIVVGINGRITEPLSGTSAPDLDKLGEGYTNLNLPKPETLQSKPPEQKESIVLYVVWDADRDGGNFVIAVDALGRAPVANSWITPTDLKCKNIDKRAAVCSEAKKSVQDYITKSGLKIERLKIVAAPSFSSPGQDANLVVPWALVDLAYQAARSLNDERAEKKQAKLEIRLPFQIEVAEPPPPEQPPEKPVEYPKDDPAEKPGKNDGSKKTD